jgi:hypothetical protein
MPSCPRLTTIVIVGVLTSDDLSKQATAVALLEDIEHGRLTVMTTDTITADCVYVHSSTRLYNLPRG